MRHHNPRLVDGISWKRLETCYCMVLSFWNQIMMQLFKRVILSHWIHVGKKCVLINWSNWCMIQIINYTIFFPDTVKIIESNFQNHWPYNEKIFNFSNYGLSTISTYWCPIFDCLFVRWILILLIVFNCLPYISFKLYRWKRIMEHMLFVQAHWGHKFDSNECREEGK